MQHHHHPHHHHHHHHQPQEWSRFPSPPRRDAYTPAVCQLASSGPSKHRHYDATTEDEKWAVLDLSGVGAINVSPQLCHFTHVTALVMQRNRLTELPSVLFERLRGLQVVDVSYNQLHVLPHSMGRCVYLTEFAAVDNLFTELPIDIFGRLYRLRRLSVEGNHISSPPLHILKSGARDVFNYCRDLLQFPPQPPPRRWHSFGNEESFAQQPQWRKISVMCYNILAEVYATSDRHPYVPLWALEWNYRKLRILSDIHFHNADIVCLQEVEALQFRDFFKQNLTNSGYEGLFKPKSRARTMDDISKVDGCAIFWKRDVFTRLDAHIIEFQAIATSKYEEFATDLSGLDRLMLKDNIAAIVALEFNEGAGGGSRSSSHRTKPRLLVANTHIHWNPEYSDVKLIQTQIFTEELQRFRNQYSVGDTQIPLIVCGDFNSMPDSGVYQLLTDGKLAPNHPDLRNFHYGNYSTRGLSHSLNLTSCYGLRPSGEPEFTNYTSDFIGVLDYIFVTDESIKCTGVLEPVDEEEVLAMNGALPNPFRCSDHLVMYTQLVVNLSSGM